MALSPEELRDRFRATLLGCAIGDALGFPYEGAPPEAIARVPVVAEDFVSRPRGRFQKGQYTDDTQMTLALAEAIIAEGRVDGRAIAQRFVLLWRAGVILSAGKACIEAVERLQQGVPWMSAGVAIGRAGNGAAMRASPIGLFDFDDLARIPRDAEVQGVITHKDPRAQAGGAAVAAAVALQLQGPLRPDTYCFRIAQIVSGLDPELASHIERLPQLISLEPASATRLIARAGLPRLQPRSQPGISPFVVPSVLMALYAFLREPEDFRACVTIALRAGGDTDTVASMAGAISGAHLGCLGLPARLRRGVLDGNRLIAVADQLFELKTAPRDSMTYARVGAAQPYRRR